ncbi:hypothetical protein PspLS_04364 [Pyricularia sp. CBS 133598]|nr:hypothetical protein PspLS_04364 [Pyricularia sp. CBS 133598]
MLIKIARCDGEYTANKAKVEIAASWRPAWSLGRSEEKFSWASPVIKIKAGKIVGLHGLDLVGVFRMGAGIGVLLYSKPTQISPRRQDMAVSISGSRREAIVTRQDETGSRNGDRIAVNG